MKIFLDTASIAEIKKGLEYGIVDGVTTNPSLVAKEGKEFIPLVREITSLVPGPVSVEVTARTPEEMIAQAERYAAIAANVVIKVPINLEGLQVVKALSVRGIRTNVTLVFSPSQALLAAKAGASYVSPFVGRIDDVSGDGMALVEDIAAIFGNYAIATEIIVASVRHPLHFVQAARIGADVATIPFATLVQLLNHPLTTSGMERFLKDWEKVKNPGR
ncbi:MAG: fructose-6-phosphate aldolase [Candidatus Aminicenantes bacterium]|nr:fructose-6-phosphate aldolase [Candidatus Aminicenantes bacterium]